MDTDEHRCRGGGGIRVALAAALMLVGGCDCNEDKCAGPEICDWLDNDCDGLTDEGFTAADGTYSLADNCGACGVVCEDVFPSAEATECRLESDEYRCAIVECPVGQHAAGAGACIPDLDPLCFPCVRDGDCSLYSDGALCLLTGSGERRCASACSAAPGEECPEGFECEPTGDGGGQCRPASALCGCGPENEGMTFPCLVTTTGGQACAGEQVCDGTAVGPCEAVFQEACNGLDDDCDGMTDEDFRLPTGEYVHAEHCGECNRPCVPPGPNMVATCLAGPPISCERVCAENFVDLDGILANGCECERTVGSWPPSRLGVDADCDGDIDDTADFVFVTGSGSDSNPGTLVFPMRTPQAAVTRAASTGKSVLIAWGRYAGPLDLAAGVSVFGGYAPDFSDRDASLFPVVLESVGGTPGAPLLTCRGITTATEVDGLVLAGSDATTPGQGSTSAYLDGCGPEVRLTNLVVYAGRGADGADGASSSQNLARWGMTSLRDLEGNPGGDGSNGVVSGSTECTGTRVAAGAAGRRSCPGSGLTLDGGGGGEAACPASGCRNGAPCGNAGCTDFTVGGVCDMAAVLAAAVPNPAASTGQGPGGGAAGDRTYDAVTNRWSCSFCDDNPTLAREGGNGGAGTSGGSGIGGPGCGAASGAFDATSGLWSAGAGGNGSDGTDGGGGGGGTCGSGYDVIPGATESCTDALGGAGGGGGSGGCGAPGADGGGGGGASAGIVVRLAAGASTGPALQDVSVITAPGGNGGMGGQGATGGAGGAGGLGGRGTFWCTRRGGRGGDGGGGGAGGGGGGGCGGSVAGFLVVSGGADVSGYAAALLDANSVEALASPGVGGAGGFSPGASGAGGVDGAAEAVKTY
ncbi:MAG: hypothetical protein HY905_26325 [Deltaproteobacteria bacterium]|nr:hypothetical protein [Deltaproteobacteria bacterium]